MVDVAFLLLTFFMLTTVFKKPGVLRMSLPEKKSNQGQSATNNRNFSVLIDEHSKIRFADSDGKDTEVNLEELQKKLLELKRDEKDFKLFIKPHTDAKYDQMIQVIDLLEFIQLTQFSMGSYPEANTSK